MFSENERGCGAIIRPAKLRGYDYEVSGAANVESLPDKYTIPEKNIPDVHDQKWTNMCVAYTLCECAEAKRKQMGESVHFSEAWTYAREETRGDYEGEGMYTDKALKGSLKLGFLEKPYFDFMIDVPDILKMAGDRDDLLKLSDFSPKAYYPINYALEDKKWETLKKALVETELPIVVVSQRFFKGGSHCILGIGYSDEYKGKKRRCIEFQNSWGEEYGNNGRSFIPLDMVNEIYVIDWKSPVMPFTDVKSSDWFYDGVRSAYLAGYVKGITDTEFYPDENMIRGDIAMILSRMMDKIEYSVNSFIRSQKQEGFKASYIEYKKAGDCTQSFSDVEADDYYCEAIRHVCANGFMNGKGENIFDPTAATTRAEMAAILSRVFKDVVKRLENSFGITIPIIVASPVKFSDVSESEWYYSCIESANGYRLMQGTSKDTFEPDRNITRAEGAVTMCRLFKKIEGLFEII